jgi:hypothetical protein
MRGRTVPLVATTVIVGLLCGAAISLAAFYVARYGPSGGNWSFQGNGALAVYTALPGVLTGGWTALALHARGRPWVLRGLAAGLVGLVLAFIAAALLPVLGVMADRIGSPISFIALLAWMVVAPVAALTVGAQPGGATGSVAPHVVAAVVWLAAALAGLAAVGILVPAGS